jgi:hypothetical protein
MQRILFKFLCVLCFLCALCVLTVPTFAQTESELQLFVRRLFGYGGGDQIEGSFRMELIEPPTLTSATFYIDDVEVGTVTQSPFQIDFKTGDYDYGWHALHAIGITADGQTLTSNVRRFEFVSASEGWEAASNIVGPVLLAVFGLIVVMMVAQFVVLRQNKNKTLPLGAPRKYGIKGGAICPKCHRPYSIHFLSFNAGPSYYDWCDHCGKWSFVRRASPDALAAAEQAELELAKPETPIVQEAAEQRLLKQIEDSRYIDDI